MENTPAVSVSGLTRRFGDLVAVDRLTFSVSRGELFGLVGPDGAGKTTTLRMLAGVLKPTSGDAIMNGISVVQDPERVKHEIAYMSQRFGLYNDLTVERDGPVVEAALREAGFTVLERHVIVPTMEDVFIDHMKRG